ncbi:MAG: hypothetical protein WCW17_04310 [Patescibacteria group bacterium]
MRRALVYFVILIILAILVAFAYQFAVNFTYTRHIQLPAHLLASTSTDQSTDNTAIPPKPDIFGQTDSSSLNPAESTIDTTSWNTYSDKTFGFFIKYPKDVIVSVNTPGNVVFSVPKDKYFHWPLLDDVKISVIVATTCPGISVDSLSADPVTVTANGYSFNRLEGGGVGAGNLYRELIYDTIINNMCYHIDLLDHGTNGAGFYVEDQSLISRYDAQHQVDLNSVLGVYMGMVNSFANMVY